MTEKAAAAFAAPQRVFTVIGSLVLAERLTTVLLPAPHIDIPLSGVAAAVHIAARLGNLFEIPLDVVRSALLVAAHNNPNVPAL